MEARKSGDNAAEGEVHKLESANHGEKKQWPSMTPEEKDLISRLHHLLGDRWELIARRLPTRTAQEVEIYWRTEKKRKFEETKIYKPLCTRLCRTRFNPTPKFTMDEALEKRKPSQTGS